MVVWDVIVSVRIFINCLIPGRAMEKVALGKLYYYRTHKSYKPVIELWHKVVQSNNLLIAG